MFLLLIKTFLCILQILHLIHVIRDKSMETPCERHYREQKVGLEMSKICAEPITARCMPVRSVRVTLALMSCWREPKKPSQWRGGCVGLRSRAQFLSTDCADQKHDGKRLTVLTTPLLLIGSDNRDVAFSAKMLFFFIWFHVIVYLNDAWIFPNIMISVWDVWLLSY